MLWALLFGIYNTLLNEHDLRTVGNEINAALTGRKIGRIFPLSAASVAIDLFPHEGRYLYINFETGRSAAAYLIRRKLRELERRSVHPSPFIIDLRKRTFGLVLTDITIMPAKRVLMLNLNGSEGSLRLYTLLGPRPNLMLVDEHDVVTAVGKTKNESGQRVGDRFAEPEDLPPSGEDATETGGRLLSDHLDETAQQKESTDGFANRAAEARKKLQSEIRKKEKLLKNLEGDLVKHGDAETWKKWGDLLLANIGNIRLEGETAIAIDYFDESTPEVEIPLEPNSSPAQTAEIYFSRYAKARNAKAAVAERQGQVQKEIDYLMTRMQELEKAIETGDEAAIAEFLPRAVVADRQQKVAKKSAQEIRGVRRFISSDGFEILVGKKAVDNDNLTFRVAKSLDLWFHAEDYPGSHVVIRNSGRKEIPSKTLLEAARLAAFYSDAREMPKVSVRYTPRKFVNKPKRAAPGLVSLASFRTLLVEPEINDIEKAE